MDAPETRYAKIGDIHLGYQIWGDGPIDLLELHNGTLISIDETTEEASWLRYERRLSSFCRLIRFDYRGLGLSDPLPPATVLGLDDLANDAIGLLDVIGSHDTVLLGPSGGAFVAMTMALKQPERFRSLVMVNGSPRVPWDQDYPIGVPQELIEAGLGRIDPSASVPLEVIPDDLEILIPSRIGNQTFKEWWIRAARRGASPTTAMAFNRLFFSSDMRARLGELNLPTLVISRSDVFGGVASHGQYLAEHIPGARYVELPGSDLIPYGGDFEGLVNEIQEFVTGERAVFEPDRALATILFTDIVGSTALAADLGDRQWRAILEDHDAAARREVARHGGRYVKDTGDGLLATFDGPAQGIRCSMAMIEAAHRLGLELRAGLHTGEIELRGEDVGGIAVHIGSRISELAGPGEVLVSSTVKDLIVGSDITFTDRGTHALKGVPGEWRVLAVAHL